MDYVCLYDYSTATAAGNCGVCGRPRTPSKIWPDYADGQTLISIVDFNPSCRHVAFDVHVCQALQEVYVVVRIKLSYNDFAGVNDGAGGWAYEPIEWTETKKVAFLRNLRAAVGLWDGNQTLNHNGTAYTPRFFVETVTFWAQAKVIAEASTDLVEKIFGTNESRLWTASVSLLPPYPGYKPSAAKGTRYDVNLNTKAVATRSCLKNTTQADAHADQSHYNPMAHEFGHLFGLPDEYNYHAIDTANPPAASGHGENGEVRVTVLEALNELTATNDTLLAGGGWTL